MGNCAVQEAEKMLRAFAKKLDEEGFVDSDIRMSEIQDVIDEFMTEHFAEED